MVHRFLPLGLCAVLACNRAGDEPAPLASDIEPVAVTGPTLVAFYPVIDSATADTSADLATVMDDFSFHLADAQDGLRRLGFQVDVRRVDSLVFAQDGRTVVFRPPADSADIGYYLAAPGKRPLIVYGVRTSLDLIDAARELLGAP